MAHFEWIQRNGAGLFSWVRSHKILTILLIGAGWIILEIVTLPFGDVRRLKTNNPAETAFMREHAEAAVEQGKHFKKVQRWISLSEIPKDAINAVIVSEDGTFWSHSGFDWFEFQESIERNLKEGKVVRGASTITQQLVKNLYLSSSKNPLRKLKEWVLTWYIERTLTKRRILELYLNVIDGVRGSMALRRLLKSILESLRHYSPGKNLQGWLQSYLIQRDIGSTKRRATLSGARSSFLIECLHRVFNRTTVK